MLRNWLGFKKFNFIINGNKNCVTIGISHQAIQQLHFSSGKLSLYIIIVNI